MAILGSDEAQPSRNVRHANPIRGIDVWCYVDDEADADFHPEVEVVCTHVATLVDFDASAVSDEGLQDEVRCVVAVAVVAPLAQAVEELITSARNGLTSRHR